MHHKQAQGPLPASCNSIQYRSWCTNHKEYVAKSTSSMTEAASTESLSDTETQYQALLPANMHVVAQCRQLLTSGKSRPNDIAESMLRDPVIVIEIMRLANQLLATGYRPAVTSLRSGVSRLGSQFMLQTLSSLELRTIVFTPDVASNYAQLVETSYTTSRLAEIIALHCSPGLSEEARIAGLFSELGHLLACAKLGPIYVSLAKDCNRLSLAHKLRKMKHFNIELALKDTLQGYGLARIFIAALDPELPVERRQETELRFIISGAKELVHAKERDRLAKYGPAQDLPGTSAFRILNMPERTYRVFYEAVETYFQEKDEGTA